MSAFQVTASFLHPSCRVLTVHCFIAFLVSINPATGQRRREQTSKHHQTSHSSRQQVSSHGSHCTGQSVLSMLGASRRGSASHTVAVPHNENLNAGKQQTDANRLKKSKFNNKTRLPLLYLTTTCPILFTPCHSQAWH